MPAIIRFSAKLTTPRGVRELPPTQAQLRASLSMNTALVTEIMPAMQSNRATSNSRPG